jgi:glutathione S-transferase
MAADPFDALRLTLMQDVLPVGMAVVERARRGGARQVLAAFDGTSPDPLAELRREGEPAASELRESLDRLQPGLGNPVLKVEVKDVPHPASVPLSSASDPAELQATLARIAARLALLEDRLAGTASVQDTAGRA